MLYSPALRGAYSGFSKASFIFPFSIQGTVSKKGKGNKIEGAEGPQRSEPACHHQERNRRRYSYLQKIIHIASKYSGKAVYGSGLRFVYVLAALFILLYRPERYT